MAVGTNETWGALNRARKQFVYVASSLCVDRASSVCNTTNCTLHSLFTLLHHSVWTGPRRPASQTKCGVRLARTNEMRCGINAPPTPDHINAKQSHKVELSTQNTTPPKITHPQTYHTPKHTSVALRCSSCSRPWSWAVN